MDITKFVVSLREKALLYGDYSTYRAQLAKKLLNCRKKLNIATKSRGKFHARAQVSAEEIAQNHEFLHLQLLTAERAWAHAMAMKAAHSADTKGVTGKSRSHIVSRLDKGARVAESLVTAISGSTACGASPTDVLEAQAYAYLLRATSQFEKQSWEASLTSYAVAWVIYSALSTSVKGDMFQDLLSETIDPSIRYAAYQLKIPRTEPIPAISRKAFPQSNKDLVDRVNRLNPEILERDQSPAQGISPSEGTPTTLTWRKREVKIEDAAIAAAWASVGTAKIRLAEKLSTTSSSDPRDIAAAYDDILTVTQDTVDATKQAVDELKAEGVTQSDARMQSLQITRTAVNYEMISWRIGRNRVLMGDGDGAKFDFADLSGRRKAKAQLAPAQTKEDAPGRQIARLKEKVVLYDGTLQSLESITELPGVANDQELSARLDASSKYFTALKCLALARSHSIAGNAANALALVKHAVEEAEGAAPALTTGDDRAARAPLDILVTNQDVKSLQSSLNGELQRSRALVDISNLKKSSGASGNQTSRPLIERLSEYPIGGVDLENIVVYPPRIETIPVKPLFLDVAWNYIDYPDKAGKVEQKSKDKGLEKTATAQDDAKPQKRGWFGFGR